MYKESCNFHHLFPSACAHPRRSTTRQADILERAPVNDDKDTDQTERTRLRWLPRDSLPLCISDAGLFSIVSQYTSQQDLGASCACSPASRARVRPTLVAQITWPFSALPKHDLRHVRRVAVQTDVLASDMLPGRVTHIIFGHEFNQLLAKGALPSTVTHLTCYEFNQPLAKGVLPSTLTHLTFHYNFNQPLA